MDGMSIRLSTYRFSTRLLAAAFAVAAARGVRAGTDTAYWLGEV